MKMIYESIIILVSYTCGNSKVAPERSFADRMRQRALSPVHVMSQDFCVPLEVALDGLRHSNAATSHLRVECISLLAEKVVVRESPGCMMTRSI